jgi:hypothetical protein
MARGEDDKQALEKQLDGLRRQIDDIDLELQRLLNARGFGVGVPDGIMGPNTRRGLRAFQDAIGVTPDGFATLTLLERLRR